MKYSVKIIFTSAIIAIAVFFSTAQAQTWQGLRIAPEQRCAEYVRKDYAYPASVEDAIIAQMGGVIYSPYTGEIFESQKETDIEHIVAVSEAHDSGLCASDKQTKRDFARDLLNLTLASPAVNRCSTSGKCAKDAADWLPQYNSCWFAGRVIAVRQKYQLSIDLAEVQTLEEVLSHCTDMTMLAAEQLRQDEPQILAMNSR